MVRRVDVCRLEPTSSDIAISASLCENRPVGILHLTNKIVFRGFRGKSFPRVKALPYLGRGACFAALEPEFILEPSSPGDAVNAFWGRAGPSGANVSRWAVRFLRIRGALARAECQNLPGTRYRG